MLVFFFADIDVPKLCEGKKLMALLMETVSNGHLVDKKELYVVSSH